MTDRLPDRESDRVLERLMGLHPKLIDLSLDRTVDLLERLGRPQDRLPPVVHVAGTNGKGSTSAFLRAIAEAAGLRVHVYSSPHLVRFAERIRLAGRIIDEEALTGLLERCEAVNENRPITFFEITTCAAFKAFSETPADLLILEVGMGGRLDSTNVVDAPAATAITPVSLDHEQFLGPGLARIAGEKAAIQKPGRLGRPQDRLPPVVHVAGTNGKGSTSAFLRAIAEAAGLRVHVYSSPHLVRFAERIRLAGRIIDEEALTGLLERCEAVNENRPITFFEITTCAAFKAFSETPADLLILEVGMGGRLDSTNVVDAPAATAITPVSLDHEQFLGPGLARIAGEKAAIQKPGVPSIVGPQRPEALAVIEETAARVGAPLARWGAEWSVEPLAEDAAEGAAEGVAEAVRPGFRFASTRWSGELPPPGLAGRHQIDNAGTAVALALTLADQGFPIETAAIRRGVAAAEWPARLQRLTRGPAVAALPGWELRLDGGHNPSAGEALAAQAVAWAAADGRPLHLICGMLNSKAAADFLAPLAPHAASLTTLAIPGEANSLSAEALAETARATGFLRPRAAASLDAAIADLASREAAPARLLICGSLYLAGRVLADHG
eukprot:g15193.t1